MINPAKKAPKANESPTEEVSHATEKQNTIVVKMKSSLFLVFTTILKTLGTTYTASKKRTIPTTKIFMKRIPRVSQILSDCPASKGVNSIIGTTTRSWKISIAIAIRPCGEVTSPFSCNNFKTIAVLLKEKRKPKKIAVLIGKPIKFAIKTVNKMVPPTCIPPPNRMVFLIEARPFRDNSIPIINSRKIIPISESNSTSCWELIKLNAWGPAIIPASRNPKREGTFIFWKSKIMKIDKPKIITMSLRIGMSIN